MAFVASPVVCVCPSIVCLCGWPLYASTCSLMANRIEGSEQSDVNDYCGNGGERAEEKGGNSDGIDWFVVAAAPAAALLLMRSPRVCVRPAFVFAILHTWNLCVCFSLEFEKLLCSRCDRRKLFLFSWKRLWFGFLFLCLPHRFIRRRQSVVLWFTLQSTLKKKRKNRNPPVPSSFLWLVASKDFKLHHRLYQRMWHLSWAS